MPTALLLRYWGSNMGYGMVVSKILIEKNSTITTKTDLDAFEKDITDLALKKLLNNLKKRLKNEA